MSETKDPAASSKQAQSAALRSRHARKLKSDATDDSHLTPGSPYDGSEFSPASSRDSDGDFSRAHTAGLRGGSGSDRESPGLPRATSDGSNSGARRPGAPSVNYGGTIERAVPYEVVPYPDDKEDETAGMLTGPGRKEVARSGFSIWTYVFVFALAGGCLAGMILIIINHYHSNSNGSNPISGPCPVFCDSQILIAVQTAALFNSSKDFVDMPMNTDPQEVVNAFYKLPGAPNPSVADLKQFVSQWFGIAGSDIIPWTPPEWSGSPPESLLKKISDPQLKAFARDIHNVWPLLGKQLAFDVCDHPSRHSLLPLLHSQVIVPGGRFRETYYWDSYWVIRGLLLSGMPQTALHVVENLLSLASTYGFVPNGGRQYYLTRSQPPLLTQMVDVIYNSTADESWLSYYVPTLDSEYDYWMTLGHHAVQINCTELPCSLSSANPPPPTQHRYTTNLHEDQLRLHQNLLKKHRKDVATSRLYTLNRYFVTQPYPRPESFVPDTITAALAGATGGAAEQLFDELATGAESGWDFSSRWFSDRRSIENITLQYILPADLNAILYRNELTLARFHSLLNNPTKANYYLDQAAKRAEAMYAVMFREQPMQWVDYTLKDAPQGVPGPGPTGVLSNFIPLWAGLQLATQTHPRVADYFLHNKYPHGQYHPSTRYLGSPNPYTVRPATQPCDASARAPPSTARVVMPSFEGVPAPRLQVNVNGSKILEALMASGLVLPGGVAATNVDPPTDQQWDYPNAWAPLQLMLIEGLESLHTVEASAEAFSIAQSFVSSAYIAFKKYGFLFEKYDARVPGSIGGGGEYEPQAGFGWTNGVLLNLLDRYGDLLRAPHGNI